MGKKSRKLRSPKYAAKASALRQTVNALRTSIEIDMSTGEEIEETIQVVSNTTQEKPQEEKAPQPEPELQLETVKVEEPKVPNALSFIEPPKERLLQVEEPKVEEKPKTTRRKPAAAKKPATTTKKTTSTTRRRRTTKTKSQA